MAKAGERTHVWGNESGFLCGVEWVREEIMVLSARRRDRADWGSHRQRPGHCFFFESWWAGGKEGRRTEK